MSDFGRLNGCEPPWVVFPDIQRGELSRYLKQGATEADARESEEYLEQWRKNRQKVSHGKT